MSDVFLSYSRRDKAFVEKLHSALRDQGRSAWVDWQDIPPTADWLAEIHEGIEAANTFVSVLSPDFAVSEVCAQEISHAVSLQKRIVPIVYREVPPQVLPTVVSAHNWIFFREQDDFDKSLNVLLAALDTDLEWVKSHTRLLTRAIEWDRQRRDPSLLLRGADLQAAESWLAKGEGGIRPAPTTQHRAFILASGRAEARRQRATTVAMGLGLAAASVLAVFALVQMRFAQQERDRISHLLYISSMHQLQQAWEGNDAQGVSELLADTEHHPDRHMEWGFWDGMFHQDLRTFRGHQDAIINLCISPDGTRLATASADDTIRIWDIKTGQTLHILRGHTDDVNWVVFSKDGREVLSGSHDATARLWNAETGQLIRIYRGHPQPILGVHFTPDGKRVGAWSQGNIAVYWDKETGKKLATYDPEHFGFSHATFSPDGKRMAIVDSGSEAVILTGPERRPLRLTRPDTIPGDDADDVYYTVFSPDGKTVLTGGIHGTATLWDAATGRRLHAFEGHNVQIRELNFSPAGLRFVTAGDDGTAYIWSVKTHRRLAQLYGHASAVSTAAFTPNGNYIITGSDDGTAKLWNAYGQEPLVIAARAKQKWTRAVFLQNGERVATLGRDGSLATWRASDGQGSETAEGNSGGSVGAISSTAFSADGKLAAEAPMAGPVTVWDVPLNQKRTRFAAGSANDPIVALACSPDRRLVAVGHESGLVIVWDIATGQPTQRLRTQRDSGAPDGIKLTIRWITFSPDGKRIAAGNAAGDMQIWDTATGQRALALRAKRSQSFVTWDARLIRAAAFSDDKTRFATVSGVGRVTLWDAETGEEVLTLRGVFPDVRAITFSPDGRRILTGGKGGVTLWDTATGRQTLSVDSESPVRSVAVSPEGIVLTCREDGTVRLWKMPLHKAGPPQRVGGETASR